MTHLVVLDCEAVQALRDPGHPKHRQVVSHTQVVATRKRRAVAIQLAVPTAVRVKAGWDRTSPRGPSRTGSGSPMARWTQPAPTPRRASATVPASPSPTHTQAPSSSRRLTTRSPS